VTSRLGTSIAATVAVTSLVRSTVVGFVSFVWHEASMPTAIAATAADLMRMMRVPLG
jgi:hypothetical protein